MASASGAGDDLVARRQRWRWWTGTSSRGEARRAATSSRIRRREPAEAAARLHEPGREPLVAGHLVEGRRRRHPLVLRPPQPLHHHHRGHGDGEVVGELGLAAPDDAVEVLVSPVPDPGAQRLGSRRATAAG